MAKSVSASEPAGVSAMNDEEELLVRCIAIRAAYGGMAGDITMLREFAAVWSTRSASTTHQPRAPSYSLFISCCSFGCRFVAKL